CLRRARPAAYRPSKKAAQPARPFSRLVSLRRDFRQAAARRKSLAGGAQIIGRRLARAAIRHDLVGDLLAFTQRSKSGTLDGADMHEHIVAAVIRLDEAVALGCVKPLHGSHAHGIVPSQISTVETHFWRVGESEVLEGSSAPEPAVPVDS